MPKPHPPPRLHVIFAREAHKAVILRRGPSSYARLSLWNTDTDVIEHGQWLRGRVYQGKSSLSPDGSLFVYFAAQKHKRRQSQADGYTGTFTAISRPPYFTALTLWVSPKKHGGGVFIDNQTVFVRHGCGDAHPNHQPPTWLKCVGYDVIRDAPPEQKALYADGWIFEGEEMGKKGWQGNFIWRWRKPNLDSRYMLENHYVYSHLDSLRIYALVDTRTNTRTEITGSITELDWDQRGRLICAKDGKLWVRDPAEPNAEGTLIEDFNGQTFEPIPPPDWAKQW